MQEFQREFIDYAISSGVLRFGDFTLKSGRKSPYFFNTGLFNTGARLARLGEFYAQAYLNSELAADVLYGPAYKGIPLVSATAIALARTTGQEVPFAFNRKEVKNHGEGGEIVGSPLAGAVLILDDVITAGTSVRESVEIIRKAGATPCGVLISLDRQEKGEGELSAIEEVKQRFDLPVHAIITLADIIAHLVDHNNRSAEAAGLQQYRERHGTHQN
jgi:orotate phosphoribosyltransferase